MIGPEEGRPRPGPLAEEHTASSRTVSCLTLAVCTVSENKLQPNVDPAESWRFNRLTLSAGDLQHLDIRVDNTF